MLDLLVPGIRHARAIRVDRSLTVPFVSEKFTGFADMPPVFATAYMVGLVEWTCIELLKPFLADSQRTVGTHVNLSHSAATPIGMTVTAEVDLVAIEGRRLRFSVVCKDEADIICQGEHERFIIDVDKFMRKLELKSQQEATPGNI